MLIDGTSYVQTLNMTSDELSKQDDYYPFVKQKSISFFNWFFIYATFPYYGVLALKHYFKHKADKSCIKEHGDYVSGKIKCNDTLLMSTTKLKEVAKKHGGTLNDVVLGLVSTSFKEYFDAKKDSTPHVTITVPYTFRVFPKNKNDYLFCNAFAGMTLYLNLENNFEKAMKIAKKASKE